jgi:N-acetylneuraminic acid mutarotase
VTGRPTDRREFFRLTGLAILAACSKPVRSGEGKPSPSPGGPAATPSPRAGAAGALAWRRLGATGPGARRDHTFVADDEGRRAFLFGGRSSSGALGDLWQYDVAAGSWTKLDARGPESRFGHNAAFLDGRLLVFGGQGGPASFFDDLWSFDPGSKAWNKGAARGPAARYGAGGTAVGKSLLVSHGFTDSGRFDDTWSFGGAWKDVSPATGRPIKRCLHRIAHIPALGTVVLFGGQTTGVTHLGDTWLYDVASPAWSEFRGPAPAKRNLYATVATNERMFVFGGNGESGPLNDLWSFDGAAWSKLSPSGTPPPARGGVVGAALPGRMLVFGGQGSSGDLDDLWELSLS